MLPQDFNYTFRIDVLPASGGKPEEHLLYLGTHVDTQAGNAAGLGNIRRPLDAEPLKSFIIQPADIAVALQLVRTDAATSATNKLKARLGMK